MVFLVLTLSLCGQEKPKSATLSEVADAERVNSTRDVVGERLILILADERRHGKDRDQAAYWLGKMRYAPAIPTLIQHITLVKDQEVFSDGHEYACKESLRMFGDEAVPGIVDAFIADQSTSQTRGFCLYSSIADSSVPTARIYAKGLAMENPDKKYQQRVSLLLSKIKPNIPEWKKPNYFESLYQLGQQK